MAWMNNGWLVGTVTGVLSGLLVWWITTVVLLRKRDREFQQQVRSANRDVVFAVRSGIAENALASLDVLQALINATARQYSLISTDLYGPEQVVEELIKEVMDSSFLAASKKQEYCGMLKISMHATALNTSAPSAKESTEIASMERLTLAREKRAAYLDRVTSTVTGLVAAVAAAGFFVNGLHHRAETVGYISQHKMLLLVLATVFAFSGLLVLEFRRVLRRHAESLKRRERLRSNLDSFWEDQLRR